MSSPAANILSFSHRCGSGVKGANPSVRDSTINKDRGIRLNKLCIVDIGGDFNPHFNIHDGGVGFYFPHLLFFKYAENPGVVKCSSHQPSR